MAMTTKPPSSHSAEWPFPFEHALLQVPSGLPLLVLSLATLRLHDSNRHKPLVMSRAASLSLPGVAQLGLPRERRGKRPLCRRSKLHQHLGNGWKALQGLPDTLCTKRASARPQLR